MLGMVRQKVGRLKVGRPVHLPRCDMMNLVAEVGMERRARMGGI